MKSLKMSLMCPDAAAIDRVARNAVLRSHKTPVIFYKSQITKEAALSNIRKRRSKSSNGISLYGGSIMTDDAVAADWGRQVWWCDRCWCRCASWERCLVADRPATSSLRTDAAAAAAAADSDIVRVTQRPTTALFRCRRRDLTCSSDPTDVVTTSVRRLQERVLP